ncbi:hypothetical protein P4O66_010039 [Electrophorus voltai]|uniref:Uncharacterized protein n=1 Tax=Electrophorus voltai TaxID=2609070 RepID=A0AAD8Z9E3_9TELE|nr:hypothetical protein P4O66_010039 [Electrophorus voltai]
MCFLHPPTCQVSTPKALSRASHPGASKLPWVTSREAASSPEEDTPPPKVKSPRVRAPTPKPHRGKKAAVPLPALEMDNTSGALPKAHVPKPEQPPLPKTVKDSPTQAGQSLPMAGGLAGVPSSFSRLLANPLCVVHVPVPVTVSVPITLNVLITLSPFVCAHPHQCVRPCVCHHPGPCPSPCCPARAGLLSGPLASPFGIGFGAAAR